MKNRNRPSGFVRAIKKVLLSAFVLLTFGAYAAEHGAKAGEVAPAPTPAAIAAAGTSANTGSSTPTEPPPDAAQTSGSAAASSAPAAPTSAPTASNGLKDGTFTGPSVDVQWGLVQVQATIRAGKITDVQFLQYPSDRRTSQRINSQAGPWLQQEAVQAQSANVDLISGATLTSEGFAQSLQGALEQARS